MKILPEFKWFRKSFLKLSHFITNFKFNFATHFMFTDSTELSKITDKNNRRSNEQNYYFYIKHKILFVDVVFYSVVLFYNIHMEKK